ncbi:MAG: hypothetical protein LBQ81_03060 [Zoogloeaceae bacterium]|nr:hypothetical protein [Zoogloeaceae bacterium]
MMNNRNLPASISVISDCDGEIEYRGTEHDLLAAGLIFPGWVDGLGERARQIVVKPGGGFTVVGEGSGNRLSYAFRQQGIFSVKRCLGLEISVIKHRTGDEERARRKRKADERARAYREWEIKYQQQAWAEAKKARAVDNNFAEQWKVLVLLDLEKISRIIYGGWGFDGRPRIKISQNERDAARILLTELKRIIDATNPRIDDVEERLAESNVIRLRG